MAGKDVSMSSLLDDSASLSPAGSPPSSFRGIQRMHNSHNTQVASIGNMTPPATPTNDNLETGSIHDSATSGSGGADDDDPLLMSVMEVLKASDKATRSSKASRIATPAEEGLGDSTFMASPTGGGGGGYGSPTSHMSLRHRAIVELGKLYNTMNTQSARGVIIGDPINDKILFVNEAAQRVFGRLDLVGCELEVLMPPEVAERHKGYIAAYVERYRTHYKKTGQAVDSRLLDLVTERHLKVMRMFNGREQETYINAWIRTLRLPGEDMSEPSRLMCLECFDAQQYHDDAHSSRIFRSALSASSDAVVIADFDGRIEWINKAMEQLGGYPLSMILAQRASINLFLPAQLVQLHEGYLAHFRQKRKTTAAAMESDGHETLLMRKTEMQTSYGMEPVQLRVDVAYNRLVGYLKSTKEFIPREEFETERLKLLLPGSIVKLMRGSTDRITSLYWEFEHTTVMFTDVVAFSTWAKNRPVKVVHDRMQPMFSEFEEIIQAYGGELIHRIGDAVMAIFGFNGEERHHARYALACAVELQQWCIRHFDAYVRIGLHSGSIGAGIYGSTKGRPGFDAWGPVVNTAKRLEAYGSPGAVHFGKPTLEALGTRFSGELHQILETSTLSGAKGVPDMETHLLRLLSVEDSREATLPEKFSQLVNFQRAKYARWRIQSEETERRLAELQKAMR